MTAVYFTVGLLLSAWFTQIPQLKSGLRLSDGQLGFALLCPAIGALVSMQLSGRLARRFGSRPVVRVGCAVVAATMPLIGDAGGLVSLVIALLVFGLADGLLDIGMNSHAVAVERAMKRVVLQSLHAAFSVGTICGALSGAAAIALKVTPLGYLSGVAVVAEAVCLVATAHLLPASVDAGRTDEAGHVRGPAPWTTLVVVLGFAGAGCMMAEGMAESWDAVFLRNQRHALAALATIGYLLFTLAQFAGRLAGDRLHSRWGSVSLVRRGAILAAAGLLLQLTGPGPYWSMAGIAVYSLGLSVLVPVVFGAVGHGSADEHGDATVAGAIARFTTLSYLGYLLGPASIGWLAEGVGLTWAMASVFLILAGVIAASPWTSTALLGGAGAPSAEQWTETIPVEESAR
jgi:predicted MFS family arabinose efflux permease